MEKNLSKFAKTLHEILLSAKVSVAQCLNLIYNHLENAKDTTEGKRRLALQNSNDAKVAFSKASFPQGFSSAHGANHQRSTHLSVVFTQKHLTMKTKSKTNQSMKFLWNVDQYVSLKKHPDELDHVSYFWAHQKHHGVFFFEDFR